jgi:PAS domain S-box-containing protein
MGWQWSIWVISELAAGIGLVILTVYSRSIVPTKVRTLGLTLFALGAIYLLLNAMEIGTGAVAAKFMYLKLQCVILAIAATIWLAFILQYINENYRFTPRTIVLLSILPVVVALVIMTNNIHHLFWSGNFSPSDNPYLFFYGVKPAFRLSMVCIAAVFLYGVFLLARQLRLMAEPLRGDAFTILSAAIVITITAGIEMANVDRLTPYPVSSLSIGFVAAFVLIEEGFRSLRSLHIRALAQQAAIEGLIDACILVDNHSHVLYMNPAAQELTNRDLADAYERPLREILPAWPQQILNTVQQLSVPTIKGLSMDKNEKYCWYEIGLSPIHDSAGNLMGKVLLIRDTTDRVKAEDERRQLELRAQVSSRLASVGEMAAGVAHEINNPLTGVIGYAQLLMNRKDIPPDIKSDLTAINDGARRVAGIVQRLLAFSRQTKPERKLVDVNELIESTLILRTYHLKVNNIEVVTKLNPHLPETVVDPGQIQQVLLNLIVNAETEMKLAHGKGKLTVTTQKSDNTIKIYVKDNGPGIKPEIMDKIFDPFFTTREIGQGTGLGLSLCYGIITEHNGKIYAESQPDKGATFILELPVVTEAKPQKQPKPVAKKLKEISKARILVVDDEQLVRNVINAVLTDEGHRVDTVDNAADALKKIESKRYNLIMLDIKMPGMNGVELYKRIQKIDKPLAGRVVFITGDIMSADTEKFLAENKLAHIDKPFDAEQLKREVGHALSGGR